MEPQTILYIILGILVFDFVLEETLDYLGLKFQKNSVPDEMKGFYDEEKYAKSQDYYKTRTKFGFVTSILGFAMALFLLVSGGFGWINMQVEPFFSNDILLALGFFAVLFVASDVINIPFQIYSTFVIEQKFGFNTTTVKLFIADKLKGYALGAAIGGLIAGGLLFLILEMGQQFWWIFWIAISAFILFINMFYTTLIVPLFNKLTPLEDGEIREAIEQYSKSVDFPLTNIFVIDGSKRSNKANAFFSGIGKKKKVVLYDTLIKNHSVEELVAIFAHEVGHYKKKHIPQGFVLSILQTGLMLFVMSTMIFNESLSIALGAESMAVHLNLIAFGLLYSPISKITGVLMNVVSRKNEFEADEFAARTYNGEELISALKQLSVDSLSSLYPHPGQVFMHYSHPPLLTRIKAIQEVS